MPEGIPSPLLRPLLLEATLVTARDSSHCITTVFLSGAQACLKGVSRGASEGSLKVSTRTRHPVSLYKKPAAGREGVSGMK